MSKRQSLAAGFVLAFGVTMVASLGHAGPRVQWETSGGTVSWHRACAFAHSVPDAESAPTHRFVTLCGSLRALARGDAALSAVFLEDEAALNGLERFLVTGSARSSWSSTGSSAPDNAAFEWLEIAANGRITVHVDEAHHPGKKLVAIVNGEGEILGAHPLWTTGGDLAALVSN